MKKRPGVGRAAVIFVAVFFFASCQDSKDFVVYNRNGKQAGKYVVTEGKGYEKKWAKR